MACDVSVGAVYFLETMKDYFKCIRISNEHNPALAWPEKKLTFFGKVSFFPTKKISFFEQYIFIPIKSEIFMGHWLHLWSQASLNFCIRAKMKHGLLYGMSNTEVTQF